MRLCIKCQQLKEENEYYVRKDNRADNWCGACHREYRKAHYQKNSSTYRTRAIKYQRSKNDWYQQIKSELKCSRCPEDHPATIDFHHIDGTKEYAIADGVRRGFSKENLLKEMEKCLVLCSNCHRKLHWAEREETKVMPP